VIKFQALNSESTNIKTKGTVQW